MNRNFLLLIFLLVSNIVFAQKNDVYVKSIKAYQKNYISQHEVVKAADKKYFRFFPINKDLNIECRFEKLIDTVGIFMNTSANTLKDYFVYGRLHFTYDGKECHLNVYQSKSLMLLEKYKHYLFVPFTDLTSGEESYAAGRYLEYQIPDIQHNQLVVDFNKAYNPYCVYSTGYKCPIPPKENNLNIAIKAGEMNFGKGH